MSGPRTQVFFERISRRLLPVVRWHALRGRQIYALGMGDDVERLGWIRRLREQGHIRIIEFEAYGHYLVEATALALQNVDGVWERALRGHPIVARMVRLFGSADIALAFKKVLNRHLTEFYTINLTAHRVARLIGPDPFLYIPSWGDGNHRLRGGDSYHRTRRWLKAHDAFVFDVPGMRTPAWLSAWEVLSAVLERAAATAKGLAALLWLSWRSVRSETVGPPQSYEYGINVVNAPRQFAKGPQGIGFLADGSLIKREALLVVSSAPLTSEQKEFLVGEGLRWIDDLRDKVSRPVARATLGAAMAVLRWLPLAPALISHPAVALLVYFAKWTSFNARIHLRHFVSYGDHDMHMISRNIVFKTVGTKTWFYVDSAHLQCYFASPERPLADMVHEWYCFLVYDYLVSWSTEISRFFARQRAQIGRYLEVGCLWSQHLLGAMADGGASSAVRARVQGQRHLGRKIVAVFDATYIDTALARYRDGVAFATEILRLAESIPEAYFVFKPKKSNDVHPAGSGLRECYAEIEKHPRCFMAHHTESPSEVMAVADLVISFPFTSTTFEALAGRQKALYFDASGKFHDTVLDRIPGLVCHGAGELEKRVREVLFETTDTEWDRFVDTQVKGVVEAYCDGRALTRFRRHLVGAES